MNSIHRLLHATITSLIAAFVIAPFLAVAAEDDAALKPGAETDIVAAIQAAQKRLVRESFGTQAGECFTWDDYEQFKKDKGAAKAAEALNNDRKFMEGVLTLCAKPEREHTAFVRASRKPLRMTWAELGRIDPAGQTEAGNLAERDIANAAADLLQQLVKLSAEELNTAFRKKR